MVEDSNCSESKRKTDGQRSPLQKSQWYRFLCYKPLEFASEERQTAPSIKHRRRHPLKGAAGVVRSTSEQFYVEVDRTAPNPSFATERNLP